LGAVIRGVGYDPQRDLSPTPTAATVDLLRANNVKGGEIVLDDVQHVSRRRVRPDQVLRSGDVLICAANGSRRLVGKAAPVRPHLAEGSTFGAFMMVYRPNERRVEPEYVAQLFQTNAFRQWVELLLAGSSINNLRSSAVGEFSVDLPAREEQRSVAAALSDADRLIDSLKSLIAKKRDIKHGMLQLLFSGRVRLPGFSGHWRERRASELLEFKNGLNKSSQYFGHGTPIVNFMDVMRSPVITAERVNGSVSLSREEIGRFSARRGDMFFTRTSESVDEVGTAAVLIDDIPNAVFSGFILRGRPITSVNTTFLAYQFHLSSVRRQVVATASYTTRALTNGGALGRVSLLVPSAEEQAAVATVISDADAEIAALERRLEVTRDVKTGMMQQLLAGRTRLPMKDAEIVS
jgi:type I restriction enzyme S subunit